MSGALRVAGLFSLAVIGALASWGLFIWLVLHPVHLACIAALCWARIAWLNRGHQAPPAGIAHIGGVAS